MWWMSPLPAAVVGQKEAWRNGKPPHCSGDTLLPQRHHQIAIIQGRITSAPSVDRPVTTLSRLGLKATGESRHPIHGTPCRHRTKGRPQDCRGTSALFVRCPLIILLRLGRDAAKRAAALSLGRSITATLSHGCGVTRKNPA